MVRRVVLTFLWLPFVSASARATPILAVDVDPLAAGIQTARTVGVGTAFDVDVVVIGDGMTPYDTAAVDVLFNDAGSVLAFVGPVTAGSLAATVGLAIEVGVSTVVTDGTTLTPSASVPPPPFANGTGGAGYFSLLGPFPANGDFILFNVALSAIGPGSSTLGIAGVFAGSELAYLGFPVEATIQTGVINVQGVSEPGTLGLFGAGILAALGRFRHHRRVRKAS